MKQHDKALSGYDIAKQKNPLQIRTLRNYHSEALKYKKDQLKMCYLQCMEVHRCKINLSKQTKDVFGRFVVLILLKLFKLKTAQGLLGHFG